MSDSRLVLDVGRPLTARRGEVVPLPDVTGFSAADDSLLGVAITHAHQDHWGLAGQVPASVPIFMGEATNRILAEAAFWTSGLSVQPSRFLAHRTPFSVGPFRLTPFLNDHSAFDAYSLLVEAGGRRLFYTGDIRGHGRKRGIFRELLRRPPDNVDVLLMEGTNIRVNAEDTKPEPLTETEVERACTETFKATRGMALALFSAQNIDRLVTIYRAALQADRDLVLDLYGASIARATGNPKIPQPGPEWQRVHVFVPQWQRLKVKQSQEFDRVEAVKPYRLFAEDLARTPERFVTTFSLSSAHQLEQASALEGASAVWSMWPGYLSEPSGKKLLAFLDERGIPLSLHHTSGHASIADLQRLAEALSPSRVVPIHTFGSAAYSDHFDVVDPQPDGVWWDV